MEESTTDAFANRDEPLLPLLTVDFEDLDGFSDADSTNESRSRRHRANVSASRLRERARDLHAVTSDKMTSPGKTSIQDRLFNKLLEQVIPNEGYDEVEVDDASKLDRPSSKHVARPAFSLGTMSSNFRRFNSRIGVVFVGQNAMIRLFTWDKFTHTLSFLAVYTFICLDPYLLLALPFAVALLFVMVPAFIARHPAPPTTKSTTRIEPISTYSYTGPPIAPARTIRPAAETSKDFFRNMRDLQNSMADFSNLHDALVEHIAPATNFSDEAYSSMIFLYLFLLTCALFISAHLIPFRLVSLISGWSMTISGHPTAQLWLARQHKNIERKAALYSDPLQQDPAAKSKTAIPQIYGVSIPNNSTTRTVQSLLTSLSEITLSTVPETAEVEIFELQHRPLLPPHTTVSARVTEWHPHLYTPVPYDPLSPLRISGSRPIGSRFFEDVQPPLGWTWHMPKWELDLEAGEWVNDRLIVGVEYDLIHHLSAANAASRRDSVNADFGGWVWDLPPPSNETKSGLERDDEVWLAYGDYNFADLDGKEKEKEKVKRLLRLKKEKRDAGNKDWEEQIRFGGRGRTGEWRRRRWVRLVRRSTVTEAK